MATHAGILAWRIPWTEEPGGLQTRMGERARMRTPHGDHAVVSLGSPLEDRPRQRLLTPYTPLPPLPPLIFPSLPSPLPSPSAHEAWHIQAS